MQRTGLIRLPQLDASAKAHGGFLQRVVEPLQLLCEFTFVRFAALAPLCWPHPGCRRRQNLQRKIRGPASLRQKRAAAFCRVAFVYKVNSKRYMGVYGWLAPLSVL